MKVSWRKKMVYIGVNIIGNFKRLFIEPWGMSAHIDLHGCNPDLIRDKEEMRRFIISLCDHIEMRRFGEPDINRFGEGAKEGFTAIQKIYDSAINIHYEETQNRAFMDVFSCKYFDPFKVRKFCLKYFKTDCDVINIHLRG